MKIFSTRELATIIWVFILLVFLFHKKSTQKPLIDVIKSACHKKLIIPTICFILYGVMFTYLFSLTKFWKPIFIKNIIIWIIFAGIPLCFGSINKNIDDNYFKQAIKANFSIIVIIEFMQSTFTFSIIVELFIIPITTFLLILQAFSKNKEEDLQVYELLSWIL